MNYLFQEIQNNIYNSVDACKNTKEIWEQIRKLMFGSDVTNHVRHSRLMDEFDNFLAKEGESLESVYERLTTLVNIMDSNNAHPIPVSINTKFLNCLQPEWSKYVTIIRHNQTGETISYDKLYDSLVQFEPHVQASKAKRAVMNHDPLAIIAHSNASSSQSYENPSYSQSPQSYYVIHPSSVVDYKEDYQGELQGDSQEDKIKTAMMLLARAITQKFSTPINNRLPTSLNIKNQDVIQDGRVDIQTKNARFSGNDNKNAGRHNMNKAFNAGTKKDEAKSNLNDEENDFMLDNSFGDETLEELTAAVIMMARIQPTDDNAVKEPKDDAKPVSEVNASNKIITNSELIDHDSNAHDPYHDVKILAYNALREAENKKRLNNDLKKQIILLQQELETCRQRINTYESRTIQCSKYKETCDELECTIRTDKDIIERILAELQIPKMPKESKLLNMFDKMGLAIDALWDRIDVTLLEDRKEDGCLTVKIL
nr:hypothetical protein [Tanacetum cinerariifolium]